MFEEFLKILKSLRKRFPKNLFVFGPLDERQKKVGLILLALALLLYLGKSWLVAATVNGQAVSRLSVIKALEKDGGKQVLDSEVTKLLVLQEARERKLTVPDSEIEAELKNLEATLSKDGQSLDDLLSLRGMSREDLGEQIRLQKLVESLLADKLNITDEEVASYIKENKEILGEDLTGEELKVQAKEQLRQQKLGLAFQEFIGDLRQKANIRYFVSF